MKLLVDENLPRSTVEQLRGLGHDVVYVADSAPGLRDVDVAFLARDERRILITFDRDFGELIFRRRLSAPPGVIYLRRRGSNTRSVLAMVIAFLASAQSEELEGRFFVITGEDIRRRPLPPE